jgi:hypothetical protein
VFRFLNRDFEKIHSQGVLPMMMFYRGLSSRRDSGRRTTSASRRRCAPNLDPLEVRALLSTLVVTNTNDSGTGSLRQAVAGASSGDTITFSSKLRGQTITLTSGELDVARNITIQGPGASQLAVSGDDASEVFNIDSGATVSISGLTITGGNASVGGGITNAGTLSLDQSTIKGNEANGAGIPTAAGVPGEGGGIQNLTGANLTVIDSTISDNQAVGAAGEVGDTAYGGGIHNSGTVTLIDSTLSGNLAIGGGSTTLGFGGDAYGGGIYNASANIGEVFSLGVLTIADSTVSGNQAIGASVTQGADGVGGNAQGGGIFDNAGSRVVINGSTFSGNQSIGGSGATSALGFGGAIESTGAILTITGSTFTDNLAQGGNGVTAGFLTDGQGAYGGGIDSQADLLTITDSVFQGNQAIGGAAAASLFFAIGGAANGGALYYTSGSSFIEGITINGTATVTGSTFEDNQAIGGVGSAGEGGFAQAAAINVGGTSPTSAPAMTISASTITGNVALGGTDAAGGSGGSAEGGGIATSTTLTVSNSTLSNNQAIAGAGGAGGAYNDGGDASGAGLDSLGGDVTLTNTQIINNQAIAGAGGNDASTPYGSLGGIAQGAGIFSSGTITSSFSNGTFVESVVTSTVSATNLILSGNQAIGGAGGSGGTGGAAGEAQGGGLFNDAGDVTLSGALISGNQAVGAAGGSGSSGGSGGAGGDSQGGGLYSSGADFDLYENGEFVNVTTASTVTASSITLLGNLAQGGAGGAGDS